MWSTNKFQHFSLVEDWRVYTFKKDCQMVSVSKVNFAKICGNRGVTQSQSCLETDPGKCFAPLIKPPKTSAAARCLNLSVYTKDDCKVYPCNSFCERTSNKSSSTTEKIGPKWPPSKILARHRVNVLQNTLLAVVDDGPICLIKKILSIRRSVLPFERSPSCDQRATSLANQSASIPSLMTRSVSLEEDSQENTDPAAGGT